MIEVDIYWDSGEIYTSTPKHYTSYQTIPRLKEISEITRALNIDFSIENCIVKITLDNSDGYFTAKSNQEEIIGKKVVVRDGVTIFTGKISYFPTPGFNNWTIKADTFSMLKSPINKEIGSGDFPDIPPKNEGWGNIIIGNATVSPGMIKAKKIAENKYFASWTECSDIVDALNKSGVNIKSNITFGYDLDKGYTYINYTSTDDYIWFSALGPEETGQLIENPAYMLEYLIENFSTLDYEGIEEAAAIFDERGYDDNVLWIDDETNWARLISIFSKAFNCRVFLTRAGKIKPKVLRWGLETPVMTIHPSEIKDFSPDIDASQAKSKWQRKFQFDPSQGEYLRTPVDIPGNQNLVEVGEFPQKYVLDEDTSLDAAQREAFFLKKIIYKYTFKIPKQKANLLELGDTVMVKHRNSTFKNEYRQVQLLRERRFPGSGFIEFEGYDMTEINRKTFILQEAGHPEVAILGENDGPALW